MLPIRIFPQGQVAVAIPARDEAEHIGPCLRALNAQIGAQADHIVLCVNNATDGTAAIARNTKLRPGTYLHVLECELPPEKANAGTARRMAMEEAARLVGNAGVLLTTDADGVADETWLAANLAALQNGADAVAGWVDLDADSWQTIPSRLHEDDARECAYDALLDEIHARLDPDPADPMPRHTQHSGASIAVTAHMYRLAGGLPALPSGEDRAFFEALRRVDARIRHSPDVHVTVSGRIHGRAAGGMAETIRRRLTTPDLFLDDRLEPADDCARRARLRNALRQSLTQPGLLPRIAAETNILQYRIAERLRCGSFGSAWAFVESESFTLVKRKVAVAELAYQIARAEAICQELRCRQNIAVQPVQLLEAAE